MMAAIDQIYAQRVKTPIRWSVELSNSKRCNGSHEQSSSSRRDARLRITIIPSPEICGLRELRSVRALKVGVSIKVQ
jgi:hypothetical protein